MIELLMILGGLVFLYFGGEGLVKGAVALAQNFGMSQLLVSAVVIGFGTSMPEMTVSLGAALKGASDIAVGNVVGSNIANILLIIGVGSVIAPILVIDDAVKRDTLFMIFSSILLCGLCLWGVISFLAGFAMFALLAGYLFWTYRKDRQSRIETAEHAQEDMALEKNLSVGVASLYSMAGLGLLIGGAYLLVEGAVSIARDFGISEAVIGLSIVAIGTSLPELATSIVASIKKHSDVIVGNILGSNIFNILSILGVTAMVLPITITRQIAVYDVWIMLATAIFLAIYLLRGLKISRVSGCAMLLLYVGYMAWLFMQSASV